MRQGTINTYLHQKVNSYLCFALIGIMTFWTGLYYAAHRAESIADGYVADYGSAAVMNSGD